ncbi:MAG: hypothetical protein LBI59_04015 [Candidatus Accumulibacter sp.]|nr:hypothetical protein [Accumulibacter sp.]
MNDKSSCAGRCPWRACPVAAQEQSLRTAGRRIAVGIDRIDQHAARKRFYRLVFDAAFSQCVHPFARQAELFSEIDESRRWRVTRYRGGISGSGQCLKHKAFPPALLLSHGLRLKYGSPAQSGN